jgi:hypothetical protein
MFEDEVTKAKNEIESLEQKIRKGERALESLRQTRPGPALAAQRGDGAALASLDEQIAAAEREVQTSRDALVGARHARILARDAAFVPFIQKRRQAGLVLQKSLAALGGAISEARRANSEMISKAAELHVRPPVADFVVGVLLEMATALDLDQLTIRMSEIKSRKKPHEGWSDADWSKELAAARADLRIEFPKLALGWPRLDETEQALSNSLEEIRTRAERQPKAPRQSRPEDQPSGVLGLKW